MARAQKLWDLKSNVDPVKIADEQLLTQLEHAWGVVLDTPDSVALRIASAEIPLFSQTFYLADAMSVFLGYVPTFRRTLNAAGTLIKAAALDAAGTAVPFLGTLMAVIDLFEPQIDKVTDEMLNSASTFERNFDYDNRLDEILLYANFVEKNTLLSSQSLETIRASFAKNELWLSGVLSKAAKS